MLLSVLAYMHNLLFAFRIYLCDNIFRKDKKKSLNLETKTITKVVFSKLITKLAFFAIIVLTSLSSYAISVPKILAASTTLSSSIYNNAIMVTNINPNPIVIGQSLVLGISIDGNKTSLPLDKSGITATVKIDVCLAADQNHYGYMSDGTLVSCSVDSNAIGRLEVTNYPLTYNTVTKLLTGSIPFNITTGFNGVTLTSAYLTAEVTTTAQTITTGTGGSYSGTSSQTTIGQDNDLFSTPQTVSLTQVASNTVKINAQPGSNNTGGSSTQAYTLTAQVGTKEQDANSQYNIQWFYVNLDPTTNSPTGTPTPITEDATGPITGSKSVINLSIDTTKDTRVMVKVSQGSTLVGTADTGNQLFLKSAYAAVDAQSASTCSATANLSCLVVQVVVGFAGIIRSLLYTLTSVVILPIMVVLLSIPTHTTSFAAVILEGWVAIRNLMNIIFIVGLVISALALLFRAKSYNIWQFIPKLVFATLAVNFSLIIAQVILGIADTLQAQFLPANSGVIDSLGRILIVGPNANAFSSLFQNAGTFSQAVSSIFTVVFALAGVGVLAAITAFIAIRIMALWLLLLTSPIAYAGQLLPQTAKYAKQWFSEFVSYAFFTPIMGLGLHLCILIAIAQQAFLSNATVNQFPTASVPGLAQFVYNILTNILTLFCLSQVLKVAKDMHISNADAVIGRVNKFTGKVQDYVSSAAKSRATKVKDSVSVAMVQKKDGTLRDNLASRVGYAALNPVRTLQETYLKPTAAANKLAADRSNAMATRLRNAQISGLDLTKDNLPIDAKGDEQFIDQYDKMNNPKLKETFTNIKNNKNLSGDNKKRGLRNIWKSASKNGKLKDIIEEDLKDASDDELKNIGMAFEYEEDAEGNLKRKIAYNDPNTWQYFNHALENDPRKQQFLKEIEDIGLDKKKFEFIGLNTPNLAAREEAIKNYFQNLGPDDWKDVNVGAADKYARNADSTIATEADGSPKMSVVYKTALDKLKDLPNDKEINGSLVKLFTTDKIERNTGAMLFKDENEQRAFENTFNNPNKPEYTYLSNRIVNLARGAKNERDQQEGMMFAIAKVEKNGEVKILSGPKHVGKYGEDRRETFATAAKTNADGKNSLNAVNVGTRVVYVKPKNSKDGLTVDSRDKDDDDDDKEEDSKEKKAATKAKLAKEKEAQDKQDAQAERKRKEAQAMDEKIAKQKDDLQKLTEEKAQAERKRREAQETEEKKRNQKQQREQQEADAQAERRRREAQDMEERIAKQKEALQKITEEKEKTEREMRENVDRLNQSISQARPTPAVEQRPQSTTGSAPPLRTQANPIMPKPTSSTREQNIRRGYRPAAKPKPETQSDKQNTPDEKANSQDDDTNEPPTEPTT